MNSHLFVIYSCKKYEHTRAKYQADTWLSDIPENTSVILMTGDGNNTIDNGGVLRLNVKDDYISLIDKTQALFDWFLSERTEEWLVKVDDDVWFSSKVLELIKNNNQLYTGVIACNEYVSGTSYIIHRSVLEKLPRIINFTDKKLSEDVAVGGACNSIGICPALLYPNLKVLWYNGEIPKQNNYDMVFSWNRKNHKELMDFCKILT